LSHCACIVSSHALRSDIVERRALALTAAANRRQFQRDLQPFPLGQVGAYDDAIFPRWLQLERLRDVTQRVRPADVKAADLLPMLEKANARLAKDFRGQFFSSLFAYQMDVNVDAVLAYFPLIIEFKKEHNRQFHQFAGLFMVPLARSPPKRPGCLERGEILNPRVCAKSLAFRQFRYPCCNNVA
jgi:hypothetical protein